MSKLISVQVKGISKFKKRRQYGSLYGIAQTGYLESDNDYVQNNLKLCVEFLDTLTRRKPWQNCNSND
jgi:hypothetical protein